MTALQAAGSALVGSPAFGRGPHGLMAQAPLGVRSLREEYLKPVARSDIPRNLKVIEERVAQSHVEPVASFERQSLPRFQHLFGDELLPPVVFIAALELQGYETLNGRQLRYDSHVLLLRDNLVAAYKPVVAKIRQLLAREIDDLPPRLVTNFTQAWTAWESAWLRNREVHAIEALQPMAKAILSLEPLLFSLEKEKLLPWPRVQHQKVVTLKCLEGFVHSFADLAGCVLPSLQRELDHDPRLLLLMDHVLKQRNEGEPVTHCLAGLSATPEVAFPDVRRPANTVKDLMSPSGARAGQGVTLDAYAFKLMGLSSGDASAKLRTGSASQGGRAGRGQSMGATTSRRGGIASAPATGLAKESHLSRKAEHHARELLTAFENVKELLLSLKSTLEHIDPALDKDEVLVSHLQRFERAFRRSKRLYLEPDNLA